MVRQCCRTADSQACREGDLLNFGLLHDSAVALVFDFVGKRIVSPWAEPTGAVVSTETTSARAESGAVIACALSRALIGAQGSLASVSTVAFGASALACATVARSASRACQAMAFRARFGTAVGPFPVHVARAFVVVSATPMATAGTWASCEGCTEKCSDR
jgi:hypothetical protein